MKIYAVSEGEYSDYRILALYTDKQNAEKMCKIVNEKRRWGEAYVERFLLDEMMDIINKNRTMYFGRITKDGDITQMEEDLSLDEMDEYGFDVNNCLYAYIVARDKDHAIKILSEKRARILAEDRWGKDKFSN